MRGIQSIERAGRILRALATLGEPAGLGETAEAAGLAPAQVHAYLVSLRRAGLVEQDGAGRYAIGPLALHLADGRMRQHPELARASDAAADLARGLGLIACVVVWGPSGPTVAEVHEGGRPLDLNLRPGTRFSVTGTASGRLFAAFLDRPEVRARLAAELGGAEGADATALSAELARIRRTGHAVARGRPVIGLNAVAVPILGATGEMAAAVTLVGDDRALPLDPDDPALAALLEAVSGPGQPCRAAAGGARP